MKENLIHISRLIKDDMVIEDSLGNISDNFEFEGGFSDQEEINEQNKYSAVAEALGAEISFVKENIRQQHVVEKYGIDISESGKEWEGTPYWSSAEGDILISDLEDNHLSRIPRHLYNNGVVKNSKDLPPKIVEEITKRGFKLLGNCIVLKNR